MASNNPPAFAGSYQPIVATPAVAPGAARTTTSAAPPAATTPSDKQYADALVAASKANPTGLSGALAGVSAEDRAKFSQGVVSSTQARTDVANAQNIISNSSNGSSAGKVDPLAAAYQQISDLQGKLKTSDEAKKLAEGNYSLSEARLKGATDTASAEALKAKNAALTVPGVGTTGATPTPATNELAVPTTGPLSTDPIVAAQVQGFNNSQATISTQLSALKDMVSANDTDSQAILSNIDAMTTAQVNAATKINERTAQAATVAGIVSGRAMYSPEEHLGIIAEVMQDGQAKIANINLLSAQQKLEANKAKREYDYKAFTDSAALISKLEDDRRDVIVSMSKRLSEIQKDAQDKQTFDAQMQTYKAGIQAYSISSLPAAQQKAAILKVAAEQGIDPAALSKAVSDQVYTTKNQSLELQQKSATIAHLNAEAAKAAAGPAGVVLSINEATAAKKANELPGDLPVGISEQSAQQIISGYNNIPKTITDDASKKAYFNSIVRASGGSAPAGKSVSSDDIKKVLTNGVGTFRNDELTRSFLDAVGTNKASFDSTDVAAALQNHADDIAYISKNYPGITAKDAVRLLIDSIKPAE